MGKNASASAAYQPLAKVSPPVSEQALQRDRLFEKLDSLFKNQVVWISSPAGSGKTTLVSTYLRDRGLPCLWYQVDIGDDDPATFFHYLGRAALSVVPKIRKAFPALTPEYLLGLPAFTLRFFEDLCSHVLSPSSKKGRAMSHADMRCAFVFDNCQEVPDSSAFHTVLLTGLTRIPSGITVILISRTPPPPAYARLQANKQMGLLGWEDLRLSQEEAGQIICLQTGESPESQTVECIYRTTDGWAAGLTLMIGAARREGFQDLLPAGSTPEEIMHYFGSELFDRLDDPTRDFLMKTSFFPRMTIQMAQDLSDHPNAGRILSNLHRNNFFIHKLFQAEPWYEYHPLFREFLLNAAQESLSEDELAAVSRWAAGILERSGQIEAAMSLLKDISGWEAMAPLIIAHAPLLIDQGRYRSLQEWLSSVPDDIMDRSPWLSYWKASSLLPFDPRNAKRIFEKTYNRFVSDNDLKGILLSVSGIIQSIHLQFADHLQYDSWIPVMEDLLKKTEVFPSKEIEARLIEGIVTTLVLRKPDHPDIEEWIARASSFIDQHIPATLKARLIFAPLFYYFYKWDVSRMNLVHERLRLLEKSRDMPPLAALIVYFGEVYYHMLMANHQECLEVVDKALSLARESGVHAMDRAFLGEAAASCINENDLHKAQEYIDELSKHYEYFSLRDKIVYYRAKAREALIRKDYSQALSHARKNLDFSTQQGSGIGMTVGNFNIGQALHFLGEHAEEERFIEETFTFPRQIKSSALNYYTFLHRATCAFDRGDDISGYRHLKEAFAIGREYGHLGTGGDIPAETAKLCVRGMEAGIEPEYARWLVKKRRFVLDPPPYHLEAWPWAVKIHTLGRFSLTLDDEPLSFSSRAQKKPLDVLKIILSGGGSNVSEASVADILWPEADGDMAMQAFATNLHRLRKLLGRPDAVLLTNGILSLDPKLCWIDAKAFELSLSKAEALWDKAQSEEDFDKACELISSALSLYRGEFLPDEDFIPDAIAIRGHLHTMFLQGLYNLGEHLIKTGSYERAHETLERGIEIDECAEELYQLLMISLSGQGMKTDALSVYERCRSSLSSLLNTSPSEETTAIAEKIRSGKKR